MVKNETRWFSKYQDRTSIAGPEYEAGIRDPRRDPTAAAIDKQDEMLKNLTDSVKNGKWADGLRYSGMAGWQNAALIKGTVRYSDGVSFSLDKVRDFVSKFAAHLRSKEAEIQKMPKTSIDQSIQKAAAQIKHNAQFRFKRK